MSEADWKLKKPWSSPSDSLSRRLGSWGRTRYNWVDLQATALDVRLGSSLCVHRQAELFGTLESGCPYSEGITFSSPRRETHGQTYRVASSQRAHCFPPRGIAVYEPSQKGSHFQLRPPETPDGVNQSPLGLQHQDTKEKDI